MLQYNANATVPRYATEPKWAVCFVTHGGVPYNLASLDVHAFWIAGVRVCVDAGLGAGGARRLFLGFIRSPLSSSALLASCLFLLVLPRAYR
jgi:hypothetical protein